MLIAIIKHFPGNENDRNYEIVMIWTKNDIPMDIIAMCIKKKKIIAHKKSYLVGIINIFVLYCMRFTNSCDIGTYIKNLLENILSIKKIDMNI